MPEIIEKNQEHTAQTPEDAVSSPIVPKRKRRWGDRYDGYRVRELDLPFWIIPNIMRERNDSQIFFEESINISELERFIRRKWATDMPNLRLVYVVSAVM